ncbi:MAG: tRNA lysidine(34) synthetase TilS [Firmicutes bacterium]|nr:tRNA lysidine(34) synthetase TilS [Bacillota bacterium]
MLRKKFMETIAAYELIEKGDHIVIGLSGGPDSVCLFDLLLDAADELDLTIHPVHVNHKFRPGAAEEDQAYVESLCRSRGLECKSFTVDCNALAAATGMTSEEAGRKARYDAFYDTAMEILDADGTASVKIAVAQNANDQAETILFRLLRGTGTDGLAGIAYKRYERGICVIRPLLDIYRDEIEAYCEEKGLDPVTDHTNNEAIYARNRIRLELLPYLESKYNENIQETLVRLGHIAAADKDYIWQQTQMAYEHMLIEDDAEASSDEGGASASGGAGVREVVLDRAALAELHPAIRHRVVLKAFAEAGLEQDITAERLEAADKIICKKQGPKMVEFPHGYQLKVAAGRVRISKLP